MGHPNQLLGVRSYRAIRAPSGACRVDSRLFTDDDLIEWSVGPPQARNMRSCIMRLSKWIGGAALAAALAVGGSSVAAWAAGPHGLPWRSPNKVSSGVPVQVASIASCPAVPTPGDSVLVQINLSF